MKFEIAPKSTELKLNWEDAILYCQFLNYYGYGWRLPTEDELKEIYNSKNDFKKDWYWSSTEGNGGGARLQSFANGNQYNGYENSSNFVRAIRDL